MPTTPTSSYLPTYAQGQGNTYQPLVTGNALPQAQSPYLPYQSALLALQSLYGQSQPYKNAALDYQSQMNAMYQSDPVSAAQQSLMDLYAIPARKNEMYYLVGY